MIKAWVNTRAVTMRTKRWRRRKNVDENHNENKEEDKEQGEDDK